MQATLNAPPNTQAFDPANRGVSLIGPGLTVPTTPATSMPAAAPMSELGHLSALVTTIFSAVNPAITTPLHVPPIQAVSDTLEVPLVPSPSDIPRFLKHASTTLGVRNVLDFESPLRRKGFGPDILPNIADSALVVLGISEGDVLHMVAAGGEMVLMQSASMTTLGRTTSSPIGQENLAITPVRQTSMWTSTATMNITSQMAAEPNTMAHQ